MAVKKIRFKRTKSSSGGVNMAYNLGLEDIISDKWLLRKAVECSDILEQKIIISTMRLLNKKSEYGAFEGTTKTSGGLAQNWRSVIVSKPKRAEVTFGVANPLVYADIHNWGKSDLKSPRGKMLAIPLSKEAHARGSPMNWGKNQLSVVASKKTGNVFLIKDTTKQTRKTRKKRKKRKPRNDAIRTRKDSTLPTFKAEYWLRHSVTIPATNYYGIAIQDAMSQMIEIIEDVS